MQIMTFVMQLWPPPQNVRRAAHKGCKFRAFTNSGAPRPRHWHNVGEGQRALQSRAAAGTVTTVESITLLSFPDDIAQEAGSAAVDSIWSLQYLVPGALCGAAGPLAEAPIAELRQQQQAAPAELQRRRFTHAVMLRFPNSRSLEAFQQHAKYEGIVQAVLVGGCEGLAVLTVPTQLPNSLEALFRRGGDFDTGYELIALLQLWEGFPRADAMEVLAMLQQLAESSRFGAVQAAQGACAAVREMKGQPSSPAGVPATGSSNRNGAAGGSTGAGVAPLQVDYVLTCRFQQQEQVEDFLRCPPVAALLQGDDRLPLRAVWAGVMEIAPTDNSQTRQQGRGGLL